MPRIAAGAMGVGATALSAYAAMSHAITLENSISYLVVAAPMIAISAALIPPVAESLWRRGHRLKAACWLIALIPATLVVFSSATTRIHDANDVAQASRTSAERAARRAEEDRTTAKARLFAATAQADRYRGLSEKECLARCRTARASEMDATAHVADADAHLSQTEKEIRTAAALTAPNWLLPIAIDATAFMGIWTFWSGYRRRPLQKKVKASNRRRTTSPTALPSTESLRAPSTRRLHS